MHIHLYPRAAISGYNRNLISQTLGGAYATNVAFGSDAGSDASSTFFKSMDEQVDIFAQAVKADEKLASGFNAIGFSQGRFGVYECVFIMWTIETRGLCA